MTTPKKEIKTVLEHINNLCSICGYFNSDTIVNNGYGCDHEDCEDSEYVHILNDSDYPDKYVDGNYWDFRDLLATRMSKRNIKCNKRLAKKFIKRAELIMNDNEK